MRAEDQERRPKKPKTWDLTKLLEGRVHLQGFDCQRLRGLRLLKGSVEMFPGSQKVVWWEVSNTNPASVTCNDCYSENPEVQSAYGVAKRRARR